MPSLARAKPSPAMVVALIALFVAASGVTWAATTLKPAKNSVKSKHLKDGGVRGIDIKNDDLTGTDIDEATLSGLPQAPPSGAAGGDLAGSYPAPTIADNAVTTNKVLNDTLTGADISESSLGPVPSAADADQLDGFTPPSLVRVGKVGCGSTVTQTTDSAAASVCSPGIPVPTIPSSNGTLKVDAVVAIGTGATGCPCRFAARIHDATDDGSVSGFDQPLTLGNSEFGQIALTGSRELDTAGTHTIQVRVWQVVGSATASASTDLTSLFVPFNINGDP